MLALPVWPFASWREIARPAPLAFPPFYSLFTRYIVITYTRSTGQLQSMAALRHLAFAVSLGCIFCFLQPAEAASPSLPCVTSTRLSGCIECIASRCYFCSAYTAAVFNNTGFITNVSWAVREARGGPRPPLHVPFPALAPVGVR